MLVTYRAIWAYSSQTQDKILAGLLFSHLISSAVLFTSYHCSTLFLSDFTQEEEKDKRPAVASSEDEAPRNHNSKGGSNEKKDRIIVELSKKLQELEAELDQSRRKQKLLVQSAQYFH